MSAPSWRGKRYCVGEVLAALREFMGTGKAEVKDNADCHVVLGPCDERTLDVGSGRTSNRPQRKVSVRG